MKKTQISGNNWDQAFIVNRTEMDFDHELQLVLYFIKEQHTYSSNWWWEQGKKINAIK